MNAMRLTQLVGIGLAAYGGWRYWKNRRDERQSWKYRLTHTVIDPAAEIASGAFGRASTATAAVGEKASFLGPLFRDFAGRYDTDEARRFLAEHRRPGHSSRHHDGFGLTDRAAGIATGTAGMLTAIKAKAPFVAAKNKAMAERLADTGSGMAHFLKEKTMPVAELAVERAHRAAEVAVPAAGKALKATPEAIKAGSEKAVAGAAAAGSATADAVGSLISNTLWIGALGGLVYYLYAPRVEDRARLQARLRDSSAFEHLAA